MLGEGASTSGTVRARFAAAAKWSHWSNADAAMLRVRLLMRSFRDRGVKRKRHLIGRRFIEQQIYDDRHIVNHMCCGGRLSHPILENEGHVFSVVLDQLTKHASVTVVQRSEEHTSELQSPDHLVCR